LNSSKNNNLNITESINEKSMITQPQIFIEKKKKNNTKILNKNKEYKVIEELI
jgi:hypothetical protein